MIKTITVCVIIILLSILICNVNTQSNGLRTAESKGYFFTTTRGLRAGRRETACISFYGLTSEDKANITVTISTLAKDEKPSITRKTFEAEDAGCFEIRIPNTRKQQANLRLQINFSNDSSYKIDTSEQVVLLPTKNFIFIQTDKEIYKPGDRVKIRILMLTQDLTVPKNLVIPIVKIRNPAYIIIGQWENTNTQLGFVQLEHQLSQETLIGDWIIEVDNSDHRTVQKVFRVKEYVLSRFEVTVEHPTEIYYNTSNIIAEVCARYTYGNSIKGTAYIEMYLPNSNSYKSNETKLENGCAKFNLPVNKIPKPNWQDFISIMATVTEIGSEQQKTYNSSIVVNPYESIKFELLGDNFIKPSIPYNGKLKILNMDDMYNKTVRICYNLAIGETWNWTQLYCRPFLINNQNLINFFIFPFEEDVKEISITAYEDGNEVNKIYNRIREFYSSSKNYIHISHDRKQPMKCKSWQTFTILYTLDNQFDNDTKQEPMNFYYIIKTKGNIIKIGKVSHTPCSSKPFRIRDYENIIGNTVNIHPSKQLDKFILTIKIHQKMYGDGELLVYYIREDREVIADTIQFQVENCLQNKVESNWLRQRIYPGETTTLKIKASSGSLCGYSVVDKKTHLLEPSVHLTIDTLLKHTRKPSIQGYSNTNCVFKKDSTVADYDYEPPYWDLKRRRRSFIDSSYKDVSNILNEMGLLSISDFVTITKPCQAENRVSFNMMESNNFRNPSDEYITQFIDIGTKLRHYFPESWLWELVPLGRSGEVQFKKELPDSITQWIGNTVCISPSAGIGVSSEYYITTFKPFFIDLITPYSLKRNEISQLKTIVFNYLNHSLPVKISIEFNQNLRQAGPPEDYSFSVCINSNDTISHSFRVIADTLGSVNITLTAEVDSSYPSRCGPEVLLNRKDVILKSILVQPEGFPFENIRSTIACANDSNEIQTEMKWNLELPHDAVKNSSRVKIILDSDLLELTVENLGYLLRIPTGCGEQIMSTLAPNYYVLRYLNATGNLSQELQTKALNNIKQGYERILQYRHKDNSFSAFGEKYDEGSTFLTAFVLRTLSQASKYVYIDKYVLETAAKWIIEKQLENGCFASVQHDFQPGMADDNVAMTAFVLISLIESNSTISENVKQNVKYCLNSYNSLDKYSMALVAYAQLLADWIEESNKTLERLLEIASRRNGLMWWENSESEANSIETTSYVIKTLIKSNSSTHIAMAKSAVRWLITKRNSYGGFISTQDTVVALDALTTFAMMTKQENSDLIISINTTGKKYTYRIRSTAKLKTKQITLPQFSKYIHFTIDGIGCVLIQTIIRYSMPQITSSQAFKLNVSASSVSTVDKCSIARIQFCVSYPIIGKHINMAVLEVTLPSGYKGDRASLYNLIESNSKLKRFEESEDKIIFYLTQLDEEKTCISFLINEQTIIENRTDAVVRLYDYYNPSLSEYKSYHLPECFYHSIFEETESSNEVISSAEDDPLDYLDYLQDFSNDQSNYDYPTERSRSYPTGLNPDFVDMDVNMEFPEGIEGPKEVYIKPPPNFQVP